MKQLLLAVLALAMNIHLFGAKDANIITLKSQNNNQTTVKVELNKFSFSDVMIDGELHQAIHAEGLVPQLNLGMPDVPQLTTSLAIPNTGNMEVEITNAVYVEYPNINLVPSKGNLKRNQLPSEVQFQKGPQYQINAFYPENIAKLSEPYILRDVRGQVVIAQPFQYNPVTKVLRVYQEFEIKVKNVGGEGVNELLKEKVSYHQEMEDTYQRRFLNYTQPKYTPVEEHGSLLIITDDNLNANLTEFVNWKQDKGIKTEVVNISEIGNNENSIFSYVQNYYNNNPDFLYLLLVGDHSQVNTGDEGSTGGWSSETKWSDTKYSYLAGNDHYPEIFIGRFSAANATDLQTMIDRTYEYEKEPMAGDFYGKAIGLGSDEGAGYGDDGEADWQHLRNIRNDLMDYGFNEVFEFYDGSHQGEDAAGNPNASIIKPAVDAGVTLFNYTGHGSQTVCVTGNYSSSHINQAVNHGKYPFVISVACNNGTFTSGTCISETWLRAKDGNNGPTGAIAACGSSILMSWAPPMATQDELVDILVESYANNKKVNLGGLFYNAQMKMLDDYGNQGVEVMETWVFFGDPSVTIRTADPVDLEASHPEEVTVNDTKVTVTSSVEGAYACLSKDHEIISTGFVQNGAVELDLPELEINEVYKIVLCSYNNRPYDSGIKVVEGSSGGSVNVTLYPNPTVDNALIAFTTTTEQRVKIELMNDLGQQVAVLNNSVLPAGDQEFNIPTYLLAAGVYMVEVRIGEQVTDLKLVVN